jgi:gliding motility-associated-like protein
MLQIRRLFACLIVLITLFFWGNSFAQVCSIAQVPANLRTELVAYYPFCANANDISGNGNVLQSFGVTPTTDRFGNPDAAYSFSNTQTNVTSYLKAVNPTPFAVSSYTISAWFNTSQFYPNIGGVTYNYQSIVTFSPQWYNYGPAYSLQLQHPNNSILEGSHWTPANLGQGVTTPSGTISVGQWYHVVLTYNGLSLKLYLNGALVNTAAASISYANQIQFLIGGAGDGPSPGGIYGGFNGKIDDVGFWRRELSQCEIAQLHGQISTTFPVYSSFPFNPLSDTTRVCGVSATLQAGAGFTNYSWNTGATTASISPTSSGYYRVTVSNGLGCTAQDSTYLSLVNSTILTNDTTICRSAPLTLSIDTLHPTRTPCSVTGLPSNLINGLIGYWPFCGSYFDLSSSANHGQPNGTTFTTDRFGYPNSAINFDDASDVFCTTTQYNSPAQFSYSVWFKSTSIQNGGIVIFDDGRCVHNFNWDRSLESSASSVSFRTFPGSSIYNTVTANLRDGNWHHCVVTFGVQGSVIYIDGQIRGVNPSQTIAQNFLGWWRLGGLNNNYSALIGAYDDFALWNRVLTASEVSQLYVQGQTITWSTGATTPQIVVTPNQSTTYSVTVSSAGTVCTDDVRINLTTIDTSLVVLDPTAVCAAAGQVRLQAGLAGGYQWLRNGVVITGATSRFYTATQSGQYRVALVNAQGCRDTSRLVSISLLPQPIAGFSITPSIQCLSGNQFSFINTTVASTVTLTYQWSFGNGITSTLQNPTYSYPSSGTFSVTLVAINEAGCRDTVSQSVSVQPGPVVNFSINNAAQCLLQNRFVFTNLTSVPSGSLTYLWSFGNGVTTTQTSPTYTFGSVGTYTVKLVSQSTSGCSDSISQTVVIHPMPVGALLTPYTSLLCEGSNVQLTAAGGATYQWFLSGAVIADVNSATYLASQPGTYTVNLVSVNGCSAPATGSVTLQLVRRPSVDFSYDKFCVDYPISFTNQSTVNGTHPVTHSWSFGAGQGTSTQFSPVYTYVAAGTYAVSLLVTPVDCPALATTRTRSIPIVSPPANQRYPIINAIQNRDFSLTARSFVGASYLWAPATGLSNAFIINPLYNYNAPVEYVISISMSSGCIVKDTQQVRVFKEKDIYVPQAFSPNRDGNNDKLVPRLVGIQTLLYFKVYNRWGQLVYSTTTINEGWDGTFKGVKQPLEGYVWVAEAIDIDSIRIKRTGTCLLIF